MYNILTAVFTIIILFTKLVIADNSLNSAPNKSTNIPADFKNEIESLFTELDYLPWEYREDLCWVRVNYVDYELKKRGYKTKQIKVSTTNPNTFFTSVKKDYWRFHVASQVLIQNNLFIVDFSFYPYILNQEEWLKKINTKNLSAIVDIFETDVVYEMNIPIYCAYSWSALNKDSKQKKDQLNSRRKKLLHETINYWNYAILNLTRTQSKYNEQKIIEECTNGIEIE